MRKKLVIVFLILSIFNVVSALNCKMEISLSQKTFKPNEAVTFRVNIYGASGNIIYNKINITINDAEQIKKIQKTANSKDIIKIDLGEKPKQGQWNILAEYKDCKATESFFIEAREDLSFSIEDGTLIIENTGNVPIDKKIQIIIGDTAGEPKNLKLDIGQQEKYRLIAPKGKYDIKIISDKEVIFSKSKILLTNNGFTGNVIGAVSEETLNRNPLTGGIAPTKSSDEAILNYMRNSKVIYTFILVIFGAMILLAIERNYAKKART